MLNLTYRTGRSVRLINIFGVLISTVVAASAQRIITTVAGNGERGFWGNGGQAVSTPLNLTPSSGGVAVDLAGNLYIADTGSHRVYKVNPSGQRLTVAGSDCWVCAPEEQLAGDPRAGFSGDGGWATNALLNSPTGVGIDRIGNLYIVDTGNQRIRKVTIDGIITTVAGNGHRSFSGDGGPAINASLNLATWWGPTRYSGNVAVDAAGNLYIADTGNGSIRKVTADGTITTVASVADPFSVAVDLAGNIYIAENTPHLGGSIHKITPGGVHSRIAGSRNEPVPGPFGPFGDGGLATDAWFLFPTGVAVDAVGNLYIADSGAQRIRKVDPEGKISTLAGSGDLIIYPPEPISGEGGYYDVLGGFSGDGGLSTNAQLHIPWGVVADAAGNIYIADSLNNRIRKVSADSSSNSIDGAQPFVRQHYLDFLNREPDGGGLAYWTNEITRCGSSVRCVHDQRIGVSAAFFIELEFQETGYFVYRMNRASFGNQPTFAQFTSDRAQVVDGSNLEAGKQAFALAWVERPAFKQAYSVTMSTEEFVNKVFDTAGLRPYTAERQQLANDMRNGKSRAQVLREVIEIAEFKTNQYNAAFVLMQYFGYLRRDPEQTGYDFWLNVLNNQEPDNYRGMVCAFLTSSEYQLRFGSLITRSNRDCAP